MDDNDNVVLTSKSDETVYTRYTRRWAMLAIVFLINLSSGMIWITFAPISHVAASYYDTSESAINGLSIIFLAAFVPFGLLAQWALDNRGLRFAVVVASIVNALGGWLRVFASHWTTDPQSRFGIVFFGQALAAFAQPVILDCPTLLVASWFGPMERATANTIASVSNPLGIAIGSVVAPLMVSDTGTGAGMAGMLLVMALPATVGAVLACVFLRSHPPTAPSASAGHRSDTFLKGLRKLKHNRAYWTLCMAFGIGVGVVSALTTLMGQIANSRGYSNDDAGFLSAAVIGMGLIGAGIAGTYVDKTKHYILTLRLCVFGATFGLVLFSGLLTSHAIVRLFVPLGLVGIFGFGVLPTGLELAVEASYPVSPGTSAGFMWMAGQVWGIVLIVIMDAMKGHQHCFPAMDPLPADYACPYIVNGTTVVDAYADMQAACWFLVAVTIAASILVLFIATPYKRLAYERDQLNQTSLTDSSNDTAGFEKQVTSHGDWAYAGERDTSAKYQDDSDVEA